MLAYTSRELIRCWLKSYYSLNDVEAITAYGAVGNFRLSPEELAKAKRQYKKLWEWSTFKFSSKEQERYYIKAGKEAHDRRFERCRKLIQKLKC